MPKEQCVVVTGASSGLGRELATLFSSNYHVILSGRNNVELEETRELCEIQKNTTIVCGDLQHLDVLQTLACLSEGYSLRYLICCAGIYLKDLVARTPLELSLDVLKTNLLVNISVIRALFPQMLPGAAIVHVNSVAGRNLAPEEAVYAASKHAMAGFLRSFRLEARDKGVRVMDVFPGAIQTPMCEGRPGYEKMMNVHDVAEIIALNAEWKPGHSPRSYQIEELHLGRFIP